MNFRIPRIVRNFYVIAGVFFLVWILFIDSNDLVSQVQLQQKIDDLEAQKEYYQENIREIRQQYDLRENDLNQLEKYAREKYYMKKRSEDVYIVVEE